MIGKIGRVLKVGRGAPAYGETLAAFFRAVIYYVEEHPDSEIARDLKRQMEKLMDQPKRRYTRKTLMSKVRDAVLPSKGREDYTLEEAQTEALRIEGTRLIRAARKRRRKP